MELHKVSVQVKLDTVTNPKLVRLCEEEACSPSEAMRVIAYLFFREHQERALSERFRAARRDLWKALKKSEAPARDANADVDAARAARRSARGSRRRKA